MLIEAEKNNLNKLLTRYSFEHLRPMPEVYEIDIPQAEQFTGTGKDRRRKIFFKVKYELKELDAIEQLKKSLQEEGLDEKLSDELLLKHIYGGKWDMEKAVERIRMVVDFHKNEVMTKFNEETIKKLQEGTIYSYGHDKGMRPVVIMRVDKFNLKIPLQQHFNAVYYLMLVVLGYRMVPYHAEKYTMIMDFNDIAFTDIPYVYLYEALDKINIYYCNNSERTLIYNSAGIANIWRIVSMFLTETQKKKVVFIPKGEEKNALQFVEQFQLQKRYGGKLPNLSSFWPPKNTNEQFDMKMAEDCSQSDFFSVQNDEEYFTPDSQGTGLCGSASCDCNIF